MAISIARLLGEHPELEDPELADAVTERRPGGGWVKTPRSQATPLDLERAQMSRTDPDLLSAPTPQEPPVPPGTTLSSIDKYLPDSMRAPMLPASVYGTQKSTPARPAPRRPQISVGMAAPTPALRPFESVTGVGRAVSPPMTGQRKPLTPEQSDLVAKFAADTAAKQAGPNPEDKRTKDAGGDDARMRKLEFESDRDKSFAGLAAILSDSADLISGMPRHAANLGPEYERAEQPVKNELARRKMVEDKLREQFDRDFKNRQLASTEAENAKDDARQQAQLEEQIRHDKAEEGKKKGEGAGAQVAPGISSDLKLSADEIAKTREAMAAADSIKSKTKQLRELIRQNGTMLTGENSAKAAELVSSIKEDMNSVGNLKRMTPTEMELFKSQVPDPTTWASMLNRNTSMEATLHQLDSDIDGKISSHLQSIGAHGPGVAAGGKMQAHAAIGPQPSDAKAKAKALLGL